MSHWCKPMQFCRFFFGSYAVILVGDLGVELFLAAWKGSCTMRDFFALAVTVPGRALDVSDGELWARAFLGCAGSAMLLTVSTVFCHLNSLLSMLVLRKKVGAGDQNCERPSDSLKNSIYFCSRGDFHRLQWTVEWDPSVSLSYCSVFKCL